MRRSYQARVAICQVPTMWILSNDYLQGKVSHAMYSTDRAKKGLGEETKKHGVYGKAGRHLTCPFLSSSEEAMERITSQVGHSFGGDNDKENIAFIGRVEVGCVDRNRRAWVFIIYLLLILPCSQNRLVVSFIAPNPCWQEFYMPSTFLQGLSSLLNRGCGLPIICGSRWHVVNGHMVRIWGDRWVPVLLVLLLYRL
ncbi:hypothetical protein GBA52_020930 [Prunus armeniaca]|nr:hypothetical protein GBA52_020930 [Prunus armeniaca]